MPFEPGSTSTVMGTLSLALAAAGMTEDSGTRNK